MRLPRILAWQFTRESLVYAALGFVAVVVLLVSQNLLRRLDQLTMVGVTAGDFLAVLAALFPMLASYAAPIALVFGLLLAIQRMNGDGETLAMQSCGIGLAPMALPALVLGVLTSAITAWLIVDVEPRARSALVDVFERAAVRGGWFEAGRFRVLGDRLIFVGGRDRENGLEAIMIADYTQPGRPLRIFAERGRLRFDEASHRLRFELERGDVHVLGSGSESDGDRRLAFDELSYGFDVGTLLGRAFSPVRPRQMALGELREVLRRAERGDLLYGLDQREPVEYALELQRRFSLPLAPLLFAVVAVPLGVRLRADSRAFGALLAGGLVGVYYAAVAGGQELARANVIGAAGALWLPTLALGLLGGVLLVRAWRGVPA